MVVKYKFTNIVYFHVVWKILHVPMVGRNVQLEINTSWKTVIVVLDDIYPYITFMIIRNTTGMSHSDIKITHSTFKTFFRKSCR
jgi:hypothetical protein